MRYTEYHAGKAVIKDKNKLSEAMEKLAKLEDAEDTNVLSRWIPDPGMLQHIGISGKAEGEEERYRYRGGDRTWSRDWKKTISKMKIIGRKNI